MDEIKEGEEKQTPRIIRRIGEDFPFLDPKYPIKEVIEPDVGGVEVVSFVMRGTCLQIEDLVIPLDISAFNYGGTKRTVVTPFHPEEGYIIDQRDFDSRERETKVRELDEGTIKTYGLPGDPLDISINMRPLGRRGGLHTTKPFPYEFSPEARGLLERLRLQLFFPGSDPKIKSEEVGFRPSMAFEARINSGFLDGGMIDFSSFYPLDTGPLAAISRWFSPGWFEEGLTLRVPSDLRELQKIKARFVLLPERDRENSMPTDKQRVPEVFKKSFEDRQDF